MQTVLFLVNFAVHAKMYSFNTRNSRVFQVHMRTEVVNNWC